MGDWHWCARGFVSESTGVWWKMTCWLLAVALGCAVEQGAVAMSYGSLWLEGAWAVRFDRVGLMSDVKVWANGLAGSFPSIFWFFLVFEISLGLISWFLFYQYLSLSSSVVALLFLLMNFLLVVGWWTFSLLRACCWFVELLCKSIVMGFFIFVCLHYYCHCSILLFYSVGLFSDESLVAVPLWCFCRGK